MPYAASLSPPARAIRTCRIYDDCCVGCIDTKKEFMTVFAKTVAERTAPGQRQDVEQQGTFRS